MDTPFKRIVVLMLENQSFDHLLGWVPGVGLLTGNEGQVDSNGQWVPVGRVPAKDLSTANDISPHHDFTDVITQMYGTTDGVVPDAAPTGQWYLTNNASLYPGPTDYMACYRADQVPVLATLAQNYTTCARWFASVPGPTGPNRLFAHCATSGGYCGAYYNQGTFAPPMTSVFNSLQDQGMTWSVYWDQQFSTAKALTELANYDANFIDLNAFPADASALPQYVFVTPSLLGRSSPSVIPPNSMHPGDPTKADAGTIADGEALVKTVYAAITADTQTWNETLLLIVFDEHGGFWDSVMPPAVVPPWAAPTPTPPWTMPTDNKPFDFMRYGPRVPAIVVSAWHGARVDASTVFEHSAIPATVKAVFGLPSFLTNRDASSPTFHDAWHLLPTPRRAVSLP